MPPALLATSTCEWSPHPAVTIGVGLGDGLLVIDGADQPAAARQRRRRSGGGRRSGARSGHRVPAGAALTDGRSRCARCHRESGGSAIALDDVWGRDAMRIEERLRATASWDDRFAIAEDTLAQTAAGPEADPEVAFVWAQMLACRRQVRVEGVADVGWSRKRLWSRFRAQVGLTPGAAQLVQASSMDVDSPLGKRGDGSGDGYVDQSHLHRDAMAFAGVSPAAVAIAAPSLWSTTSAHGPLAGAYRSSRGRPVRVTSPPGNSPRCGGSALSARGR